MCNELRLLVALKTLSRKIRHFTCAGSGQDNHVDDLKCGRWAQNNDLYGGNALVPFLDFCQIAGNQCNARGERRNISKTLEFSFMQLQD